MRIVHIYLFLISVLFLFSCKSRDSEASLSKLKESIEDNDDTLRYKVYDSIAKYYLDSNPRKSIEYSKKALEIALTIQDNKRIGKSYFLVAYAYDNLSLYNSSLEMYQGAYAAYMESSDSLGMADALINTGAIYKEWGNYDIALKLFINASLLYEAMNDKEGQAFCENNIGVIYYRISDYDKALSHYKNALKISLAIKDSITPAFTCNNIGLIYLEKKDYKKALEYFERSLNVSVTGNDSSKVVTELNNIGLVHLKIGNYSEAIKYANKAYEQSIKISDKTALIQTYKLFAEIYIKMGNNDLAINYCNQCLNLAKEVNLKITIAEIYNKLSNIYASKKQFDKAYDYHVLYFNYNDSIFNEEKQKKISQLQASYESDRKEKQIKILEQKQLIQDISMRKQQLQRNGLFAILLISAAFVMLVVRSLRRQKRNNYLLRIEQTKSDLLLLNILPASVAKDLKEKGRTEPRNFNNVSVFFSDFVGFTGLSSQMEPSVVISELNEMFTAFDDIMSQHDCERIKTIGDAYMAVCGVPEPNVNHAENILQASIKILNYLNEKNKSGSMQWKARIGVHSGTVVGGVVGVRKYIFDVFGDTVNIASRMETNSQPMRINVSESTYEITKDKFKYVDREEIEVKGKGKMKMYFLEPE